MKKWIPIVLSLIFLLAIPAVTFSLPLIDAEVAIGGWSQSPSGDIGYMAVSADDKLDLEKDMGYDGDTKIIARAKLKLPIIPGIYIANTPMEFEGTGQKDIQFSFGDENFNGSVPFTSKLNMDHWDVALYYGIPFLNLATIGKLNIDLGINVRLMDIKAEIEQTNIGKVSKHVSVPVPMAFVAVQVGPISKFSVEAEGRGVAYGDNQLISFIGRIKVHIFGPGYVAGGFRYDNLTIDESDVEIETTFSGPFLEAGLQF